ncbi:hypothetical protein ABZ445_44875 [Streptomyces chartreusis]
MSTESTVITARALLLDMDGTLVNSDAVVIAAGATTARDLPVPGRELTGRAPEGRPGGRLPRGAGNCATSHPRPAAADRPEPPSCHAQRPTVTA